MAAEAPRRVWLRPRDFPHLRFSTSDVERFLSRFEGIADSEGASGADKVRTIVLFITEEEKLRDVEEMVGYERQDWGKLKSEMLARWGKREPRFWESDFNRAAEEAIENGGVQSRKGLVEYMSRFERIYGYLAKNEVVAGQTGAMKRAFLGGLAPQLRSRVQQYLYDHGLVKRSLDGSVAILPDLSVIRQAVESEIDLDELIADTAQTYPSSSKKSVTISAPAPDQTSAARPPTPSHAGLSQQPPGPSVGEITEILRDIRVFLNRTPAPTAPAAAPFPAAPSQPRAVPPHMAEGFQPPSGSSGSYGSPRCSYCGERGHWKSVCEDLTRDMDEGLVRASGMTYIFPTGESVDLTKDKPPPMVQVRERAKAKTKTARVSLGIVTAPGTWVAPRVEAEVRALATNERIAMDVDERSTASKPVARVPISDGPSSNPVGKKKAADIVRRVMGNDSPIPLTLRELAAVSPAVVDEMVQALKDCGQGRVPTTVQRVNVAEEEMDPEPCRSKSVSVPLAYVAMTIAGRKVWAMVDSGSMVNLLPSRLVDKLGLVRRKCAMGLRALNGGECRVDGVVEAEEVEVAKVCKPLSFLSVECGDVILGRPFMFGFRAQMAFNAEEGTEALTVEDLLGARFETTICDHGRGKWVQDPMSGGNEESGAGVDRKGYPAEDFS